MKMIGNQRPSITWRIRILENFSQPLHKVIPVGIAAEYRRPFNAPDHDMVQGAGRIYTRSPWHAAPLPFLCHASQL
jgi:hypothetical protein